MSQEIFVFLSSNPAFVSDITPDLKCNLCNNVMIKATYLPCGCEYCFKCICNYLDGGKDECPQKCEEGKNRKIKLYDMKESSTAVIKINRLVVKCTNKFCEFQDKVAKVVDHLKTCDKAGLNCPLFPVGCQTRGLTEESLKVHMMENQESHFSKLIEKNKELKTRLDELEGENVHLDNENKELKKNIKNIESELDLMKKEKENVKEKAGMKNLSPFYWLIGGVADKKKSSDIWWSLPFYSEEGGYKMEAGIQFTSSGYFYLSGRILRSKNDSKLFWPCSKCFNVKLKNPATGAIYYESTVQFDGTAASRPKESRNLSIMAGYYEISCITAATSNDEFICIANIL